MMQFSRKVLSAITPRTAIAAFGALSLSAMCKVPPKHVLPERSIPAMNVCTHFDTFVASGVPESPLKQAMRFYQLHRGNKEKLHRDDPGYPLGNLVAIADYSQRSDEKRFYILRLDSGELEREFVSHGSGFQGGKKHGDPNADGRLDRCDWKGNQTNMTRAGFFKLGELYYSAKHGQKPRLGGRAYQWPLIQGTEGNGKRVHDPFNGRRMDGLTKGVNDQARSHGVVMHGAWYNDGKIMGRSYGCPAFKYDSASRILLKLVPGTLFYSYTGSACPRWTARVLETVPGWQTMCDGKKPGHGLGAGLGLGAPAY